MRFKRAYNVVVLEVLVYSLLEHSVEVTGKKEIDYML